MKEVGSGRLRGCSWTKSSAGRKRKDQMRRRGAQADVRKEDEDENLEDVTDSEDDENDSDEIKALKVDSSFIFAMKPTNLF